MNPPPPTPSPTEGPQLWELTTRVDGSLAELVADLFLNAGCKGTAEEVPLSRTGARRVRGYVFPPTELAREVVLDAFRTGLRTTGIAELESLAVDAQLIPAGGWEEKWKERWRPFRIGCFVVVPLGQETALRPSDRVLPIEPGGAFGTGLHPTTRMCLLYLRDLQALDPRARRTLDVGTGTGILALGAEQLGHTPLLAIEISESSCRAARPNFERASSQAQLICATPAALHSRFELLLANIETETLVELAPELARLAEPGAMLIASGIDRLRFDKVDAAFGAQGFARLSRNERGKWAAGWWQRSAP
jgi:ribosomal protein L11 methyltransferase